MLTAVSKCIDPCCGSLQSSLFSQWVYLVSFPLCMVPFRVLQCPSSLKCQRLSLGGFTLYFWTLSENSELSDFLWEPVKSWIPPFILTGEGRGKAFTSERFPNWRRWRCKGHFPKKERTAYWTASLQHFHCHLLGKNYKKNKVLRRSLKNKDILYENGNIFCLSIFCRK